MVTKMTRSEIMKECWARPGFKENQSKITKKRWDTDTEFRRKQSEGMKRHYADHPGRRSELVRDLWSRPDYRIKTIKAIRAGLKARRKQTMTEEEE